MKYNLIALITLASFTFLGCEDRKVETGSTTAEDSVRLIQDKSPSDTLSGDSLDVILPTNTPQQQPLKDSL